MRTTWKRKQLPRTVTFVVPGKNVKFRAAKVTSPFPWHANVTRSVFVGSGRIVVAPAFGSVIAYVPPETATTSPDAAIWYARENVAHGRPGFRRTHVASFPVGESQTDGTTTGGGAAAVGVTATFAATAPGSGMTAAMTAAVPITRPTRPSGRVVRCGSLEIRFIGIRVRRGPSSARRTDRTAGFGGRGDAARAFGEGRFPRTSERARVQAPDTRPGRFRSTPRSGPPSPHETPPPLTDNRARARALRDRHRRCVSRLESTGEGARAAPRDAALGL